MLVDNKSKPSDRVLELDILRGIAIFLVLGAHVTFVGGVESAWWTRVFLYWKFCGWIGVDLFFVLSGFLISNLLFREYQRYKKIHVMRFFVRRGFKIYPAFYLFILITIIRNKLVAAPYWPNSVFYELLFVQNYAPATLWPHTWSLAVEEHFYLALPLLLLGLTKKSRPETGVPFGALPFVVFTLALAALSLRWASLLPVTEAGIFSEKAHFYPTHLRFDSLMFGVLLSYYYNFFSERTIGFVRRYSAGILVISALFVYFGFSRGVESAFTITIGLSLLYLGFGGILLWALISDSPLKTKATAKMKWVGDVGVYSYSIYLWHYASRNWGMLELGEEIGLPHGHIALSFFYIPLSLVVGITMSKIVEIPALRIRDRLFPSYVRTRGGEPLLTEGNSSTARTEPPPRV